MNELAENPISAPGAGERKSSSECLDDELEVSAVTPFQRLYRRLLSNADGRPSVIYRAHQACVLFFAFQSCVMYGPTGDANFVGREFDEFSSGTQAMIIAGFCCQSAGLVCLLLVLEDTRNALKPNGELDQLGAGTLMISKSAARSLRIWNGLLVLPAVAAVLVFLTFGAIAARLALGTHETGSQICRPAPDGTPRCLPNPVTGGLVGSMSLLVLVLGTMFPLGFWTSVSLGSALARGAVDKVQRALTAADPRSRESWDKDIAQPALALDQTMRTLSRGWSRGLLGLGLTIWLFCLNFFLRGMNTEYSFSVDISKGYPLGTHRNKQLLNLPLLVPLPLLLTMDVAMTSSRCDELMSTLNSVRMRFGEETNERITWLEMALKNLHHGQGLGFTIGGNVVDRRTLRVAFFALFGGVSSVLTALLALRADPPEEKQDTHGSAICGEELQAAAVAALRAVMAGRNATCAFNITVDEAIAM